LSLVPIPGLDNAEVSLEWSLFAFHATVAAVLIPLMRRTVARSETGPVSG
jgi:hypothetical protein